MPVALLKNEHLEYKCPACGWHGLPVKVGTKADKFWEWNGDLEKPTISPSVKHFHNGYPAGDGCDAIPPFVCHYFIKNGNIEFCGDCTHDKAGQTLPLAPYSEAEMKMNAMGA